LFDFERVEQAIARASERSELDDTALLLWLRREFPRDIASQAVEQIRLRYRAKRKFSRAERMWFTPHGLEQSSSEQLAAYHASRFPRDLLVVDAGCGIGGDLLALAQRGEVAGIDRENLALRFARRNLQAYGVDANLIHADITQLRLERADYLFWDPSRRREGVRSSVPGDWSPPWGVVCAFSEAVRGALVKTSPALRVEQIPPGCEREYVSVGGECRELLLAFGECRQGLARSAFVLEERARLVAHGATSPGVHEAQGWVYDPDPAVVAAHLIPELAELLNACQLHPRIAYLTSDVLVQTPFARAYQVLEHFAYSRKRLFERLRVLKAGGITVKKRGVAVEPQQLTRLWKPAGDRAVTVLLYRSDAGVMAVLAEDTRSVTS
jgi:SAM-dependent methyltransferase